MSGFGRHSVLRDLGGLSRLAAVLVLALAMAAANAQTAEGDRPATGGKSAGSGDSKKGASPESDAPFAEQAAPMILVDEPVFQFGEVWSGTKVQHTFEVRNMGDSVLKISRVRTSCGCTVAQGYDREIAPGAVGHIPVIIKTDRLRAKVSKTATIESNDAKQPSLRLTLQGEVKHRFVLDPPRAANFGRIKPGQKLEQKITLTNSTDGPIELTLPNPKAGVFTAELLERSPGQVYELIVQSEGPYAASTNRGTIRLQTNLPDKSTLDVTASAFIPPPIEIRPRELSVSKSTQPTQQRVTVQFFTEQPRKVVSAVVDDPAISVSVSAKNEDTHEILLDLPAGYLPAEEGRTLTIKTDYPKEPEHTISIKPRVRPAMSLTGQEVPSATFETADGKTFATGDASSEVMLLKFYASWCGYCKRALPKLNDMAKEYKSEPIRFAGISQDTLTEFGADPKDRKARSKEQVVKQWEELGIEFTQAFDPSKAGRTKFKVQSFPTMFLLGKTGRIERVYLGYTAVGDGSLKRDIDTLLSGRSLAQAVPGGTTARGEIVTPASAISPKAK